MEVRKSIQFPNAQAVKHNWTADSNIRSTTVRSLALSRNVNKITKTSLSIYIHRCACSSHLELREAQILSPGSIYSTLKKFVFPVQFFELCCVKLFNLHQFTVHNSTENPKRNRLYRSMHLLLEGLAWCARIKCGSSIKWHGLALKNSTISYQVAVE